MALESKYSMAVVLKAFDVARPLMRNASVVDQVYYLLREIYIVVSQGEIV